MCLLALQSDAFSAESYFGPHSAEHLSAVERHHLPQARDKMRWDNPKYAWEDIEFILRHFPNHPQALMLAVDLGIKSGDDERVKKLLNAGMRFDPSAGGPFIISGIYEHKKGRYSAAISNYEKAISLDQKSAEAYYNLGLAYFAANDFSRAREAATSAYTLGYPLPALKKKLIAKGMWTESVP